MKDGFRYILVIMDDLSNFVSLEPAEACTAEVTAKHLLNWCKTMGVPRMWVSDTATHFKNRVIAQLSDAQSFCCGQLPVVQWVLLTHGREVVRALKSIWSEQRKQVAEWVDVCLLYTSPSPRDQRGSRMPSSA